MAETVKSSAGDDPERTSEQAIIERMKAIRLPEIKFNPPATIMDAVQFFHQASKDYDNPALPVEERGFNFFLRPREQLKAATEDAGEAANDFSDTGAEENTDKAAHGLAPIPTIAANNITFYEALKLVCDSVDYKFIIRGSVVMVMHKDMSTAEILARKYNVPESFIERVSSASEEIKTMGGFSSQASNQQNSEEAASPDQDWKAFFGEMGVKWPEGSSIKHIKSLGKLYVRNTRENLAEFEKVLDEPGGQPQLIEIETRFVEVSQEDLNSLGFEWILNDNYTFGFGRSVGKALGLHSADFKSTEIGGSVTESYTYNADGDVTKIDVTTTPGTKTTAWQRTPGGSAEKQIGINAFGGTSDYGNGSRYLSTEGNHISGEGMKTNDQFMRLNAFLGDADLSMILHMLSQRSDTDLLSAPKVVTQSGQQAVIKVVTEYIYPQDYDVQLQSSSSSHSSSSGGSQSAILAVVEPQNFTMREVGVILDVTPTYSEANGGSIDLELKPQVVDEPSWKNYGMKIPYSGNSSLQNFEGLGGIFEGLSAIFDTLGSAIPTATKATLAETAMSSADAALQDLSNTDGNMTYYDAPMEQPFFHVRAIESRVSITPGSTVVMGGLITEARKAMDDKVPFLGDLPFIGRLFRSHAEQTIKRNLLVFVTGRLITPSGRELKMNEQSTEGQEVKAAPAAE
jgi:general secretion pathway protein D